MKHKPLLFSMIVTLTLMMASLACEAPFDDEDELDQLGATTTMRALLTRVAGTLTPEADCEDDAVSEDDNGESDEIGSR
jgi:hypothetical protein